MKVKKIFTLLKERFGGAKKNRSKGDIMYIYVYIYVYLHLYILINVCSLTSHKLHADGSTMEPSKGMLCTTGTSRTEYSLVVIDPL